VEQCGVTDVPENEHWSVEMTYESVAGGVAAGTGDHAAVF